MYANRLATPFYVKDYVDMPDRQKQGEDVRGYDPNSMDASFARLFQRMDNQDATLLRIEDKMEGHGKKLEKLESERKFHWGLSASGFIAAVHHTILTLTGK
jgi:hypothetical protein